MKDFRNMGEAMLIINSLEVDIKKIKRDAAIDEVNGITKTDDEMINGILSLATTKDEYVLDHMKRLLKKNLHENNSSE